jgi:hypothetical protein
LEEFLEYLEPITEYPWWSTEDFHQSHRGRLYDKDPEFYQEFKSDWEIQSEYLWPINESKTFYTI